MKVQCCVCHKVREGKTWSADDSYDVPRKDVSHGYCPKCEAKAIAELHAFHRRNAVIRAGIQAV